MTTYIQLPVENGGGGGGGGGGGSAYWGDAVPTFASLGIGAVDGEVKLVLDTNSTFRWNGGTSQWQKVDNYLGSLAGAQAVISTAGGVTESAVTATELSRLTGVTSNVQTQLNNKLSLGGGALTGALTLANDPAIPFGAATKQYVDAGDSTLTTAVNAKVAKAGDTMTGALTLSGAPTSALHAATKQYVDAVSTNVSGKVSKSGDTMTGLLTLSADPSTNLQAATKQYVDTNTSNKLPLSGGTLTGTLTLAGDPVSGLQAATKAYVDAVAQGLDVKQSCHVATTGNVATLSGLLIIDNHQLEDQQRVLVRAQSTQANNGIYLASAGPWTRALDFDNWLEIPGAFTFIEKGDTYADTGWVCTSNAGGTIGVTAITFSQFSGAGSYQADGDGIYLDGNTFKLELDGSTLSKSATGLKIATGGVANAQVATNAAIALSKLQSLSASQAVITNASGTMVAATTSATELSYLIGVTSSVQTQLNGKAATGNYVTALTGDVTATGPGSVAATVANVGGKTAAQVATSVDDTTNATNLSTASRIMKRDASGNVNVKTLIAETQIMVGQNATPASSAALEISSTTGALLMPRMTTAQRDALTGVNGMLIYNTSTSRFEGYCVGAWVSLHGWGS